MKILVLLLSLLLFLPHLYAQDSTPTPTPEPASTPAPADNDSIAEEAENSPKMKEKINVAETPDAESLDIPPPPDTPDPDSMPKIDGLLPGEQKPTPLPAVTGTIDVNKEDNDKTIRASVGNLIRIALESRPNTGYNWELRNFDFGVTIFHSSDLVPRQENSDGNVLFGAPGDTVITLQAIEPGEQDIHLVYRRPWEPPDQVAATFTIHLIVTPPHDAALSEEPPTSETPPANAHDSIPTP